MYWRLTILKLWSWLSFEMDTITFYSSNVHLSAWIILANGTTKYNSIFVFGHTVILLFSSNQSQSIDTTQVYKLEAKFVSRHNESYPRLDDKTVAVFRTCHVFRSSDSVPSSSSNLSKASLSSLRLSIQGLHKWKIPALPETRTALQKNFKKNIALNETNATFIPC